MIDADIKKQLNLRVKATLKNGTEPVGRLDINAGIGTYCLFPEITMMTGLGPVIVMDLHSDDFVKIEAIA